ncbi:MAG: Tol-Pal system beta propeller repeat protein TolB [Deltaproteobacteria bacterium]|nr:Tol-Pal system beta propeller repeat protein TolB [Deltaproteobacteria bacterium]
MNQSRTTPLVCAVVCASALCTLPAFAGGDRPVINVEGARIQAYPIAIAPAMGEQVSGQAIAQVLAADFDRSGLFKVLNPDSFLADPKTEGLTPDKIDFNKWTTVGAAGLVKLQAFVTDKEVKVEFHLYDSARAAQILSGTYSSPHAGLRQIAHRFADDVVKYFTQQPGDFETRIAYVRHTESGKQIVIADSDGFNAQALTGASINLLPAWAPDGKSLAFTTFRDGAAHIYSVDASSRAITPLVLMGDFATGASYAPDGLRFTFSASRDDNTDVYLSQSDGSAGRQLTDARGIDISASWSPDGKQLAFISDRAGSPQLYLMNADGTNQRRLTFKGNYNQEPAWSPKGDLIAFSGRDEKRMFDIYTVAVASGEIKRLTGNAGTNEKPTWSPSGRTLMFVSSRSGKRQLWTMTFDGNAQRQLTNEPMGASDPAWGPASGDKK